MTNETTETVITGHVIDEAAAEKIAHAMAKVQPLDPQQKQNLQEILRTDSYALSMTLRAAVNDRLKEIEAEVRAASTLGDEITEISTEAARLIKRYKKDRKALMKRAKAADIRLTMPHLDSEGYEDSDGNWYDGEVYVSSSALQKQIAEAQAPVHEAWAQAQRLLNEQEAKAQRQILVASINSDAKDVLAQLPSQADLLAAFVQALPAIESKGN